LDCPIRSISIDIFNKLIGEDKLAIEVGIIAVAFFAALAWGGNENWAIALITIVAMAGSAVFIIRRVHEERKKPKWQLPYAPLVAFLIYASVGLIIGKYKILGSKSIWETVDSSSAIVYLLLILSCAAIIFLTANEFRSRRHVKLLAIAIIVLGTLEAAYGLVQYLGDYDYIWQFKRGISPALATGTFINRNHYALLLNLCICIGIGYLNYRAHRLVEGCQFSWRAALSAPGSPKLIWMLSWLIIMGVSLVFSMSRMGIAAMVASLSAILFVSITQQVGFKITTMGLLLLIAVIGLAFYIGVDAVLVRYESLALEQAISQDRPALWRDAWKMAREFPLCGQGLGTFQWTYPAYQTVNPDQPARYAHNDYLQLLMETGIIGLGFILWLFASVWRIAMRNLRNDRDPLVRGIGLGTIGALTAIALQEITDFGLYIPGVAVLAALIVGLNLRARLLALEST
jgi:O-antigen ligase